MNKVFKVIWSEARNAYVVVSEIAKNHGSKSCSTKKLLAMLIATGVMTCASMAPAMAADPPAEALKHNTVAAGYNITVTPKDNSDGGKEYNVDLKNDIHLAGDDPDALVSISGSKGTIWATGSVTVGSGVDGSVVMDGTTATVSGLGNTTTAYAGFANGKGKAATEEQLKEISEVAENANQGWNLSTNGGEASKVAPGETVDFSGDKNINISNDGTNVKVELNNDINLAGDTDFVSISGSKGTIWATGSVAAGNVVMDGHTETVSGLSNKTTAYAGFANGEGKAATEEQLKEVSKVAENANQGWNLSTNGGEASKVAPGETVDFSGDKNINISNDGTNVKVELNNDINLAGDTDFVSISGSKGTIWATGSVAAGNVVMDGHTETISGLSNTTTAYAGFANGEGKAATEEQLKEVATEAGKHTQVKAGTNVSVVPGETADGTHVYTVNADGTTVSGDSNVVVTAGAKDVNNVTNYGVKLNKDLKGIESVSNGSAKLALNGTTGIAGIINGQGASVYMQGSTTVINSKISVDKDGKISGVAAGKISADSTDAVNGSQLNAVATEAGKHSKVVSGNNINVEETDVDGQKFYKVNMNKDIMLGDLTGKNVSISGTNGTIEATGAIATKDRVYADKGAKLADIDVTGDTISNGGATLTLGAMGGMVSEFTNGQGASVKLFGDTTTINGKVNVYKDGRIAGVADGVNNNDAVNVGQLQKAAAASATTVSDGVNTTVTATKAEDGHTDYKVNLNKDLVGIESISNGGASLTMNGFATELANGQGASVKLFGDTTTINGKVTVYKDGRIAGVADGINNNDAVNVGQLKEFVAANDTHIKSGDYAVGEVTDSNGNKSQGVSMDIVNKAGDVTGTVTITDVAKASDVGNVNNIASDIKNKEGKTTVVDAVNNLNNKVGDLQYSKVEKGEIADGDSTTTAIGKLDQKLTDVAATAAKHSKVVNGSNINVEETDDNGQKIYKVNLNKDIMLGDLTGKNVSISGTNGTIETTGYIATKDRLYADKGAKLADIDVTGNKISNGASSIVLDGSNVKVNDKVTIDQNGKVTGVADGDVKENSKDAVNGSQLYKTNQEVVNNTNRINQLGSRVNKVGAGAAALAALHPMDFDPDDKLTFSAGYGNYAGENAAAIGAYYRPDEKVMFSVAGTVGNGENMVNAGVSFALDRTNHVSNSRTALAREVIDLRGQLAVMGAKMAKMEKAFGMLDETKTKLFPDVPANHWAYEYIAKLAGNGYIEGYPDGNFGGDRLMTRYEFAAMLYRAIENGAALEEKIIKEFEPELGRIRVERISGEDGDRDKIERVRVNDTKGERDHYGNKLAK